MDSKYSVKASNMCAPRSMKIGLNVPYTVYIMYICDTIYQIIASTKY